MKKPILFLSLGLLLTNAMAKTHCFLAKEHNQILKQAGTDCDTRYAPASTFKIALSLIGYDAEIFQNETQPEWPFKEGYDFVINVCKSSHNPQTWIRDSCVWYSRVLTQKLGMDRFKTYIVNFDYGNQDLAGDKGKNNGLSNAWLSSSLKISTREQTAFLQKLVDSRLPISAKSQAMTKKIMYIQELSGGWKLYGRTGNGSQLDKNGLKSALQHGWFVGWIEKNGRVIVFANHIVDDKKQDIFASFRARNDALIQLWYLIDELEK